LDTHYYDKDHQEFEDFLFKKAPVCQLTKDECQEIKITDFEEEVQKLESEIEKLKSDNSALKQSVKEFQQNLAAKQRMPRVTVASIEKKKSGCILI